MDVLRFVLEAPRLSRTNKKRSQLDTTRSLHAESDTPSRGGDGPRLSSVASSCLDVARAARPGDRALCLMGTDPAIASDQPSEPIQADNRPNTGQIVTSESCGTSAEHRNADRDGMVQLVPRRGSGLLHLPASATIHELRSISPPKRSGTPASSLEGHVMRQEFMANADPILQSNSTGKHPAAIPQTSLQTPRTCWLPETISDVPSGPSSPQKRRESGDRFRSANAPVDSPYERSTHRPYAEYDGCAASLRLSGAPPAPSLATPGVSWLSLSSPSGPSRTKTASYSTHAPQDASSFEPRQEPVGGHFRALSFPHESREVTRSYPWPADEAAVITKRLSFQPYPVERNNSRMETNEDVDYDPKESTDKVSLLRSTAVNETESDEDPLYDTTEVRRDRAKPCPQSVDPPQLIPDHGTPPLSVATRAVPNNIQGNDCDLTYAYDIDESQGSSKRHPEKSSVDMHQNPIVQVDSPREEHTHICTQLVDPIDSLQPFTVAVTASNWTCQNRGVPSNMPELGSVTPYNGQSHESSSATNKAPVPEEATVVNLPTSSKFQQFSRPPQGVSMDSDVSHSRSLARPYTVSSIASDIPGPNSSAIAERSANRSIDSDYLDSYAPSVSEVNVSREMYPLPPDFGTSLSRAEPSPSSLTLSPKADRTVKTHSNNDLIVRTADVDPHLYTPGFTGIQQLSIGGNHGFSDRRWWTEGSSNAHLCPGSTHEVVLPQGHGNHIDARPPSLYEPQQYSVTNGKSSNMGFKREQPARPGLPAKPSPIVLPFLPAPQSPPIVSEQPRFYPPPSTGRSPPRGTEQDTRQLGGKYPPGGMNVNILCCSKSSTQPSRH